METQSLITRLMVADAKNEDNIVTVYDLPDSVSLMSYFEQCAFIPEKAEIIEKYENTDQGHLVNITIKANVDREDDIYERYYNKPLLLYIETLNGERYYLGKWGHHCRLAYSRKSAPTISDSNENELTFACILPK